MTTGLGLAALLALLIASIAHAAGAVAVGEDLAIIEAQWGTTTEAIEVAPGDLASPLVVTMQNIATVTMSGIQARLKLPDGFRDALTQDASVASADLVPSVPAGGSFTAEFTIDVLPTAQVQTYTMTLEVEYRVGSASQSSVFGADIAIRVSGRSSFEVTLTPVTLVAGSTTPFAVTIRNNGAAPASTLEAVLIVPTGTWPIAFINRQGRWEVPYLGPGQAVTLNGTWAVSPSTSETALGLTLTIDYRDTVGVHRTASFPVGVRIAAPETNGIRVFSPTSSLLRGLTGPVTLVIENTGSVEMKSVVVALSSQDPLSVVGASTFNLGDIPPLTNVSFTAGIYVETSSATTSAPLTLGVTYLSPDGVTQTAERTLTFLLDNEAESTFRIVGTQWSVNSAPLDAAPGDRGVNLVISLHYYGVSTIANLRGVLALPQGFSGENGSVAVAYASDISPDEIIQLEYTLDIGNATGRGRYAFPLELSWDTVADRGLAAHFDAPVALNGRAQLRLASSNVTVTAGHPSEVSFEVENVGTAPAYSPTFSLSLSSPLVIMSGSPLSLLGEAIAPGESLVYDVVLSTSPSASLGIYAGSLTVGYTDQSGNPMNQSFSAGLVLTGAIELIIQNKQITQTDAGISVSGSLLNQGNSVAYYTSITGALSDNSTSSSDPYYAGEVDPSTPVPFTVTIPYTPRSNATERVALSLVLSYRDAFGAPMQSTFSTVAELRPVASLSPTTPVPIDGSSSDQASLVLATYGVLAAIAASAVGGVIFLRRRRSREPELAERESKVI